MGSQVQKLLLVNEFRMHGRHFENAFGKGAGLVEDHGFHLGQLV